MEKRQLTAQSPFTRALKLLVPLVGSLILSQFIYAFVKTSRHQPSISPLNNPDALCPIPDKIFPAHKEYDRNTLLEILHDSEYRNRTAAKLSGAVQVPTEVYDEWGFIDDHPEHWEHFIPLHQYLNRTYPLVHKHLQLEKVLAGLLYTWPGSDSSLKPLVLMAHQDVVPVQKETISDWTYDPFSGFFDGQYIWGRGASDCKLLLTGLFEAVEVLLSQDFKPQRTVILSFGADEEAIGRSAYLLSRRIKEVYGEDSVDHILDEGGAGFSKKGDKYFLGINTGEKGYLDAMIDLTVSIPDEEEGTSPVALSETAVGIMAELVVEIEATPYEPILSNINPTFGQLQCLAEHSSEISKQLKSDILRSHMDAEANANVVDWMVKSSPAQKFLITTSQAVDIIKGDDMFTSLLVNNRISVDSTVQETSDKLKDNLLKICKRHDLGLVIDSETIIAPTSKGFFNFAYKDPLPTAPVTPLNDDIWNNLVGTLRHLYEDEFYPEVFTGDDNYIVTTPSISTGNTDTKSYWDLTDHIFRFIPGSMASFESHVHSVDEKSDVDSLLFTVAFYYEYLLNLDQDVSTK